MRVGAIDQGTTSTRIMVVDPSGARRIAHSAEHRQIHPRPGWVEHDPDEIVGHIRACLDAAGPLDAVGLDNQGESCLAWDGVTKEALSPILVWQDERTAAQIEAMRASGAETLVLDRAGLPLDAYFSASKLAWILAHTPRAQEARARGTLRLGTTDAFFMDRLAGRAVTDVATASRTALMNLESRTWDPELCALFGVPGECLPEIVPNTGDFGAIGGGAGAVPVTALIVDQQAALYGAGCRQPGEAKMTFGTGAFALMVTGAQIHRAPERGLLPTVAWQKAGEPAAYALDGGVFTAGAAVNWARGLGLFEHYDQIEAFDRPPAIDRGLVFVPALAGLGCPHWDRGARGTWLGLGLDHGPADLMQAVLEGIALRAAEVLHALDAAAGQRVAVSLDGGLTTNPYFVQTFTDAVAREVTCRDEADVTALGTAMLAGEAIGAPPPHAPQTQPVQPRPGGPARMTAYARAIALCRDWSTPP